MISTTYKEIVDFIKRLYPSKDIVPLHEPVFIGNEKEYLNDCIDSTYVSSVGKYVDLFEEKVAEFTGTKYAIAVVNGTSALHIALKLAGVKGGDKVITQPLTFIATPNAIKYCNADPVFVDVDKDSLGLSPEKLEIFLNKSNSRISAVVPMHTFGHPARIEDIIEICDKHGIPVVEDATESLGSYYKGKHAGTYGKLGVLSFNGNKIITTGGGGMIITDDKELAIMARHLTTQAKVPHKWDYIHDEIGYNYRLTNIQAAIGVAQMEQLEIILKNKRNTAIKYNEFFKGYEIDFINEPKDSTANYWLNSIILNNLNERNEFLKYTNLNGVMTRPAWQLMTKLDMFKSCYAGNIENSEWITERLVNIPSSFRL